MNALPGMEESHIGFGLLRIRVLGLEEFRAKHGPQSVVPFLRTAAQTLRHSLDAENFLGCWEENEFLAVLPSASPMMVATTAETLWNLLRHSEVLWWGDRFLVEAEVAYTVATAGQGPGIASQRDEAFALERRRRRRQRRAACQRFYGPLRG